MVENRNQMNRPLTNIILILTDDQGYADISCFGGKGINTVNLDTMASEGRKFTNFHVVSPVCSASRAGFLTGCYCERVGCTGVLFPRVETHPEWGGIGLNPEEETIPKILKREGYTTMCIGKWHLGDEAPFLPLYHSFDQYFGIPYSNDMCPEGGDEWHTRQEFPPLPYYEGNDVVETDIDQSQITKRYTERALDFIEDNRDKPFFLYFAHNMPHVPLHVSERFKGTSERGLYGDVLHEIDWSVGEVLNKIKELNLEKQTLIIFTSDNGPWLTKNENAGCAEPLRDGKFTFYEGGMRVPCIMWWPGRIKNGTECDELIVSIDLLPTFSHIAETEPISGNKIDGLDILPLIYGEPGAKTPHKSFFYGNYGVLSGGFKYFYEGKYIETERDLTSGRYIAQKNVEYKKPRIYNIEQDIGESEDMNDRYKEEAVKMRQLIEEHNKDLMINSRPIGRAKDKI